MRGRAAATGLLLALLVAQASAAPTTSSPAPAATTTAASPPPVLTPAPTSVAAAATKAAAATAPAGGPPPPPANPNATALFATLQMQGSGLWPFKQAAANAVVQALSQVLTTVTISGINLINATQAGGRRRLLADTVRVALELEGTSPAAALAINSDLGNNVLNGNLQATLARNGLPLDSLSLTFSDAVAPMANFACAGGSFNAACLSGGGGGLSKGSIIGIAVGAVVGALALILLCVTCVLRCAAASQADNPNRIVPNRKAMTPQHAQPFWEQNKLEAEGGSIALAATAGSSAPVAVPAGVLYAETREMGGRAARDQLKMRLPEFAGRTSRQPSGISRAPSGISRHASLVPTKSVAAPATEGEPKQ